MTKFKRRFLPYLLILLTIITMFMPTTKSLASATSNSPYTFYQWASGQSGGVTNTYVIDKSGVPCIRFVTNGNSGKIYKYKTIGFQVRTHLKSGTKLWTIISFFLIFKLKISISRNVRLRISIY